MCRLFCSVLALLVLSGCARYEFDLVEPAEYAQHIGKAPAGFHRDAIDYQLQAFEGRLVMTLGNTSDSAIDFVGQRGYVVDPFGQSHPFPGQSIAPKSFIRLVLPPLRPVYRVGPSYAWGGPMYPYPYWGYRPYYFYRWYGSYYYEPSYMVLQGGGAESYYWSWTGESSIRLRLAYHDKNSLFQHDFTFRRTKM